MDRLWGSMGITRSTRYTLVPRFRASRSRALPSCHIMAHIRDVHAQTVYLLPVSFVQGYGVVQILGVLPVYGDRGPVPQILPARHIRFADNRPAQPGLPDSDTSSGNSTGRSLGPHNGHNVHSGVIDMPQDLRDLSLRLPSRSAVGSRVPQPPYVRPRLLRLSPPE